MHLSRTVLVALVATTTSALPVNENPKVEQSSQHGGYPLTGQSQQQIEGRGHGRSHGMDKADYQGQQQGGEHTHDARSTVMETSKTGFVQQDGSCASQPDGHRSINQRCVVPQSGSAASMPLKSSQGLYTKSDHETLNAQVFGRQAQVYDRQAQVYDRQAQVFGRQAQVGGEMPPMINNFVDPTQGFDDAVVGGSGSGSGDGNLQLRGFPIGRPTGTDHTNELWQQPTTGDRLYQGSSSSSGSGIETELYSGQSQPQPQANMYYGQPGGASDGGLRLSSSSSSSQGSSFNEYGVDGERSGRDRSGTLMQLGVDGGRPGRDRSSTIVQLPRSHHAINSLYENNGGKQPILSSRNTKSGNSNGMGSGDNFATSSQPQQQQPRSEGSWFQGLFGSSSTGQTSTSGNSESLFQGSGSGSGDRESKLYSSSQSGDHESSMYSSQSGNRDSSMYSSGSGDRESKLSSSSLQSGNRESKLSSSSQSGNPESKMYSSTQSGDRESKLYEDADGQGRSNQM